MEPEELKVSEDGKVISIKWSDGHNATYTSFNLRSECPCAMCHGEPGVFGKYYHSQKVEINPLVEPREINSVGRYGMKILWSDGHDLGIYGFDYLRKICECEECLKKR